MLPESLAMPGDYRLRFDDGPCRTPVRPRLGGQPEETIANARADTPLRGPSKHKDLAPQGDDLSLELQAALKPGTKEDKQKIGLYMET